METNPRARGGVPWLRAVAVLAIGMLAAGAFAIAPATAKKTFTKQKALNLFYSKSGADARFISVGEKASDSDRLDGQDSSAFLGATGKAADADKVDGLDSTTLRTASRGVSYDPDPDMGLPGTLTQVMNLESLNESGTDQRIAVSSQSRVLASADLQLSTGSAAVAGAVANCNLIVTPAGGSFDVFGENNSLEFPAVNVYPQMMPVTASTVRPPGTYDVGLLCSGTGDLEFEQGDLLVWAVPV